MGIYDKLSELEEKTKKGKKLASPSQPQAGSKFESLQPKKIERKETIKQSSNIANNIAILQLTNDDIEQLKETAYQAQTYRLSEREIEWIKDTAYRLSKEVKRGKVAQTDILRVSLKLFENLLATNKAGLITILEKIK